MIVGLYPVLSSPYQEYPKVTGVRRRKKNESKQITPDVLCCLNVATIQKCVAVNVCVCVCVAFYPGAKVPGIRP